MKTPTVLPLLLASTLLSGILAHPLTAQSNRSQTQPAPSPLPTPLPPAPTGYPRPPVQPGTIPQSVDPSRSNVAKPDAHTPNTPGVSSMGTPAAIPSEGTGVADGANLNRTNANTSPNNLPPAPRGNSASNPPGTNSALRVPSTNSPASKVPAASSPTLQSPSASSPASGNPPLRNANGITSSGSNPSSSSPHGTSPASRSPSAANIGNAQGSGNGGAN